MKANTYTQNNTKIIKLLPRYFKWAGLSIIIILGLLLLTAKVFIPEFIPTHKQIILDITPRIFLLGLILISLARDKVEDELTLLLRLKALGFTFILTTVIVIVEPLTNLIWNEPISNLTNPHLVLRMLIAYLIIFFFIKKVR